MKNLRLLVLTLLTALLAGGSLHAQTIEPKLKIETFFNILAQGDPGKAYDALFNQSNLLLRRPDAVSTLKRQSEAAASVYGKTIGSDLIDSKALGTSVQRLVYVQKLEKYLLVWEFFYYKANRDWSLVDVRFSDNLDLLRPSEALLSQDTPASGSSN